MFYRPIFKLKRAPDSYKVVNNFLRVHNSIYLIYSNIVQLIQLLPTVGHVTLIS